MLRAITCGVLILAAASMAAAQTLEIDKGIVTRADSLHAVLKLQAPLKGAGKLTLTWTDSFGRTVGADTQDVNVQGDSVPVVMPLARAVAMDNFVAATLKVDATTVTAPKAEFIVTPSNIWDDYQIIMYYAYKTPQQQEALRDLGITAGQIGNRPTHEPNGAAKWWKYNYRFYCDQISTFFYAAYHTPAEKPKGKALTEAKALYRQDRTSKEAFYRNPSLSDPKVLDQALDKIKNAIENQMRFKPLMYAETDEGGVAELVSAWDFDFSPIALDAMRKWLMEQYGSLEAINKEWGTHFAKLEDVTPLTTDEMMARGDDNLSPWADHRFFMNKSFADDVAAGAKAGHEVDKDARVGLVGCQMPSAFGGYDYWLLSQAMDAIEPYNIGDSREVWGSFAPGKPALTTSFGVNKFEVWRLWYQALQGDQGIIIYDENSSYLDADAKPTQLGAQAAPTYAELTGGIVKQLHYMTRPANPIAIHYSQASITANWMFEAKPEGKNWISRGSATERRRSDFLRERESWTKLVEDDQYQTHFVSYAQLEDGAFDKSDTKVLILPQSIAMSEKECKAVRDLVARGGTVIADSRTALMDGHCKMLPKGQLDDLFGIERSDTKFAPGPAGLTPSNSKGAAAPIDVSSLGALDEVSAAEPGIKVAAGAVALYTDANGTPAVIVKKQGKGMAIYLNAVVTDYHRWRLKPPQGDAVLALVSSLIKDAGVTNEFNATIGGKPATGIELFPFDDGDMKMLAIHRNYQLRISELGPTEYQSQAALAQQMNLTVNLGKDYAVYDTLAGKSLGTMSTVKFSLDEDRPMILALLPAPAQAMKITAPVEATCGNMVDVKLELIAPKVGDMHAFHVVIKGPNGAEVRPLTQTLAAAKGEATFAFPIAVSDPKGVYVLVARDIATGITSEHKFTVK